MESTFPASIRFARGVFAGWGGLARRGTTLLQIIPIQGTYGS